MKKNTYNSYGGGGQQMNPTAMWFAQMGAEQPSQEEMMMMQQQQAQQQEQPAGDQMLMDVMQALQQAQDNNQNLQELVGQMLVGKVPAEVIVQALVQIGAPVKEAERLVMSTEQQIMQMAQQQEMRQQQEMAQRAEMQNAKGMPMGKRGYINKVVKKARAGMSMDAEAAEASATNYAANMQPSKNAILNYNKENIIRKKAAEDYDAAMNMQQQGEELEQARYGRARARRDLRRQNRQNRQVNRTISNALGDIAFPSGVAPMMLPGSPMMMGTPSVMDIEVERGGLFNRIKKVKAHMENTGAANMPVNFAQGVFMNGLYNPMSMMGSGDFMYDIIFPATRETVFPNTTGGGNITITNDPFDGSGGSGGSGGGTSPTPKPDETGNTEPEGGCGEGMKWDPMAVADNGKKGACVEDKKETEEDCTGGRKWDPLAGECVCSDPKLPYWDAKSQKCVALPTGGPPRGDFPWLPILTTFATGTGLYANRDRIVKYLVDRGQPVNKKTVSEALQEITDKNLKGYLSKGAQEGLEPLIGKDGQLLMGFFDDIQTVQGPQDLRALPGQGSVGDEVAESATRRGGSGNMFDYPQNRPKMTVPDLSPRQKRKIAKQITNAGNDVKKLQALATKYRVPIGTPKGKPFSAKYLRTALKKGLGIVFEEGGVVDSMSDLYKFTGGGQGVDYFGDGGYYEDGGTNDFEMFGQPAYKNIYDPYMPYAKDGIIAGQYPMTQEEAAANAFYPTETGKVYNPLTRLINTPVPRVTDYLQNYTPADSLAAQIAKAQAANKAAATRMINYQDGGTVSSNSKLNNLQQDQVLYMSPKEVSEFLQMGGSVEFID